MGVNAQATDSYSNEWPKVCDDFTRTTREGPSQVAEGHFILRGLCPFKRLKWHRPNGYASINGRCTWRMRIVQNGILKKSFRKSARNLYLAPDQKESHRKLSSFVNLQTKPTSLHSANTTRFLTPIHFDEGLQQQAIGRRLAAKFPTSATNSKPPRGSMSGHWRYVRQGDRCRENTSLTRDCGGHLKRRSTITCLGITSYWSLFEVFGCKTFSNDAGGYKK